MASKVPAIHKALILADSFNERLAPLTFDVPRALIPLNNTPTIDYTIEFLATAGMTHIFVFSQSHSHQIKQHVAKRWGVETGVIVTVLTSQSSGSSGDALREVFNQQAIDSHFVLVPGDLVCNMKLTEVFHSHLQRFKADQRNILTMTFTQANPRHSIRPTEEDPLITYDPSSSRLLSYDSSPSTRGVALGTDSFEKAESVRVRYDLVDCYVDICSPVVLQLFHAEFDYGDLRKDFVRGVLQKSELETLQHEIHVHIAGEEEYAVRVRDLPTYKAVSLDVLHRWSFPLVPDTNWNGPTTYRRHAGFFYKEESVVLSPSCDIGENVVLGGGVRIGKGTKVTGSVIGENCDIGDNVEISGCFIWNNVKIEDNCSLFDSILSHDVKVQNGTKISPGTIIGKAITLSPSLPLTPHLRLTHTDMQHLRSSSSSLGEEGAMSPFHEEKNNLFVFHPKKSSPPLVGEEEGEDGEAEKVVMLEDEEVDDDEGEGGEEVALSGREAFRQEINDTLVRGMSENLPIDQIILEIKSLRLAYDATFSDCLELIFPLFMEGCEPKRKSYTAILKKWKKVLGLFCVERDDQVDVIFSLQEFCGNEKSFHKQFCGMLHCLYELDLIEEESIFEWETGEKEEEESPFLHQCTKFLEWLREDEESD